jgi:hypothetical protein
MTDLMQTAGAAGVAVLGLGALGLLASAVWAALAAFRMRVPSPVVFGLAFLTAWAGYLAAAATLWRARAGVATASAETRAVLAQVGWAEALAPLVLAWGAVAAVAWTTAWLSAIGHAVAVGPRPIWSWGRATASTLLGGAVGFALLAHAAWTQRWSPLLLAPALLLLGAPALGLVCLRLQDEYGDHSSRIAAARLKVGAGLSAAALAAAIAVNLYGEALMYGAAAHTAAEDVVALQAAGAALRGPSWVHGVVGGGAAALLAASAGLSRVNYLDSRRSALSGMFMAFGVLCTALLHIGVTVWARDLLEPVGALIP